MQHKVAPWAAGAAAAATIAVVTASGFSNPLEARARDFVLRLLPARPAAITAIIAIDERSIGRIGPWPWPRATIAELVETAADAGARGIVLDTLLTESRPGDETLGIALRRVPSIAAAALDPEGKWLLPSEPLLAGAMPAHAAFELDGDGVFRRFASTKQSADVSIAALPLMAASLAAPAPVPVGRALSPLFRTRPASIPLVSAAAVLSHDRVALSALAGRLAFIGPTALALGDRVITPVSSSSAPDEGVRVHAAATEAVLRGEILRTVPPLGAALAGGALVFAVVLPRRLEGRRRYAVGFALLLAPSLFGFLLLTGAHIAPPVVVLTAAAAAAFAWTTAREALGTLRHGRSAARVLESQLGIAPATAEPGLRLEELALLLARRRVEETEAKRVLAHELKTPLASMKSLAQLLREFPLTEAETRRVASLLHGETEKLQSMVERLLELERLALLDFDSEAATLDLGELVARRVEFLRAGTDRALLADVDRPPAVRGNKVLLERALDNLVGNSIRYAPPPAPILVRVFGGGEGALLEVEDRGPGIPAEEREIVLRRFARGASARGKDGLGLGLALVAEVARWHRGTVEIDEAPAGGAIVRLRFPLAAEAQRKEAV